jgi:hypothetical protein
MKKIPNSNIQHPEKDQDAKNQHPGSQMFELKEPASFILAIMGGTLQGRNLGIWNLCGIWLLEFGGSVGLRIYQICALAHANQPLNFGP